MYDDYQPYNKFSKKENSNIVSVLYMIIAWIMLIYSKIN